MDSDLPLEVKIMILEGESTKRLKKLMSIEKIDLNILPVAKLSNEKKLKYMEKTYKGLEKFLDKKISRFQTPGVSAKKGVSP